jgi:hypothetical protein
MPETKYNSKIVFYGETLMDLTGDNVTADKLLSGTTAHDKTGAPVTGTCTFDADTTDATATAAEILVGKTAYKNGQKVTGTMPNKGAVALKVTQKGTPVSIPAGYHDGSGTAGIADTEEAKLIAGNIKSGVEILGVTGTYAGELVNGQKKTVTPAKAQFSVLPDEGYDHLTEVVVNAVPIAYTDNAAGGQTVTIGA